MAVDPAKSGYQELANRYELSATQVEQLHIYCQMLISWNDRMNLTALLAPDEILAYHFKDSLEISRFYPMDSVSMMADVGTGAGFPAIPLKIMYPELAVVLIEVSSKRISFLQHVIDTLGLKHVEINAMDWRTFVRKTEYPLDLVIARASLAPQELIRMFKGQSHYSNATLIYWASQQWEPEGAVQSYLYERHYYDVGDRKRQYAFFRQSL